MPHAVSEALSLIEVDAFGVSAELEDQAPQVELSEVFGVAEATDELEPQALQAVDDSVAFGVDSTEELEPQAPHSEVAEEL